MAESQGNPALADTYKRSIFKWMSNAPDSPNPSAASRELVAECLGGVKSAELADDDEEDDLLAPLTRALRDLVRREALALVEELRA